MANPETICQQFAGSSYNDREYKRAAAAIDWHQVWPEINRHGNLTGRLIGDEDGFYNVGDEAMISRDEARAGRWRIEDGCAREPEPVAVEVAVSSETINLCGGVDGFAGLEHPFEAEAAAAYRAAAINALRDDPRAGRLEDCPPRGQRILHSQWCGAHWGYSSGAIGTMATDLTGEEKAAISAADEAGREAARKVIAEADAPTAEQITALGSEAAEHGDLLLAAICCVAVGRDHSQIALTGDERRRVVAMTADDALAEVARCLREAAAQRDE